MKKGLGILSATFFLLALIGCNGAGTIAVNDLSSDSSSVNLYDDNDDDDFDDDEFDDDVDDEEEADEESSSSEIDSDEFDDDVDEESSSSNVKFSSSSDTTPSSSDVESSSSNTEFSSSSEEPSSDETESSSSTASSTALMLIQEYESKYDFIDDGWRDECLRLANEYRATEGVAPLVLADDDVQWCTTQQAIADMEENKAHSHFDMCKIGTYGNAQNTGHGTINQWKNASDAIQTHIKRMWDEKDLIISGERDSNKAEDYQYIGHYLNMRNSKYTKLSCGITISEDGVWDWFNMNFYY